MEKEKNIDRIRNQISSHYLVHGDSTAALSMDDPRAYQVRIPPSLKDFF